MGLAPEAAQAPGASKHSSLHVCALISEEEKGVIQAHRVTQKTLGFPWASMGAYMSGLQATMRDLASELPGSRLDKKGEEEGPRLCPPFI